MPLALQGWRGESAEVTGLVITAATLSWTGGSWLRTRWIAPARAAVVRARGAAHGDDRAHRDGDAAAARTCRSSSGSLSLRVAALGIGLGYSALSLIVLREAPPGREGASTLGAPAVGRAGHGAGNGHRRGVHRRGARAGAEAWVGLAGAFGSRSSSAALGFLGSGRLVPDARRPPPCRESAAEAA